MKKTLSSNVGFLPVQSAKNLNALIGEAL